MRGNRKNARLEQILGGVFQQPRLPLPPDYLIVDTSRLFARTHFACQPPIAVPNRKLSDRCLLRNRKEISSFERRIGIISKNLLYVSGRHLRRDLCLYLDGFDWKGTR